MSIPVRSSRAAAFLLASSFALLGASAFARQGGAPRIDFNRDIRPILAGNCLKCHGPDLAARQGGLRLDRREDLTAKGPVGRTVTPGKLGASRLWARITEADPARRMPPPASGKSLTDRQKQLVKQWILQGAKWSQHWAFVAPQRPPLPAVKNAAWVRNPIDRFILARLEREKLAPSPAADRITLLRRLSLDLIGLPPTPAEADAFVADRRPGAYERQVERLLASPHYGERWGRQWLDAARYADSDGFEKDKPRSVWFYRDWVINALNRDMPYNQFVIKQFAGDLLPNATQDDVVATGFLRNSLINEEGGVDPEQFRMEAMFDRMDALGKSVLGLTIQCGQCHSHKYDPLTQEEYYGMFAFLNNCDEANVAVYGPADLMKRAEILRRTREIEGRLQHENPGWEARMAAWERKVSAGLPSWTILRPDRDETSGQRLQLLPDGSILAQGYAPTKHTGTFTAKVQGRVTGVRLELLNDPNLPRNGPGRSIFGLCALTEFRVEAAQAGKPDARVNVKIASATADVNPTEAPLAPAFDDRSNRKRVTGPIEFALDGKDETAWGLDIGPGRSNLPRNAVFDFEKPLEFPNGGILTIRLVQNHGGWNSDDNQNNNLGRFRLSVTDADHPLADMLPAAARAALAIPADRRSPAQAAEVFSAYRLAAPEWKAANDEIERLWAGHPQPATQLVLHERSAPRSSRLLERGDFLKPKQPVEPGVPAFLHPLPAGAPRTRLTFARWLVDPRSPTTARSIVNRVWQAYFGSGIVRTSEDLGTQSEPPSHRELLDWLATEFMAPTPLLPAPLPPNSGGSKAGVRTSGRIGSGRGAVRTAAIAKCKLPIANCKLPRALNPPVLGGRGASPPASGGGGAAIANCKLQIANCNLPRALNPPVLGGRGARHSEPSSASQIENRKSKIDNGMGWSLKALHRLIVTSATYRQSSRVTPERYAKDPDNRLLSRGARFRVEGEVVRDIALAASGLLNNRIGGPSVFPPAPDFLFQPPASYGPKVWHTSTGADRYRRALYTFRFRSVPYPALQTFDVPNGDQSCVRRVRSNTPLQALTTLNEPLFVECAQALGLRTVREGGATNHERLAYAFRRCLARRPAPREESTLLSLLDEQEKRLGDSKSDPWAVACADPETRPSLPNGVTPAQLAAWTLISRVLLNLDETISKE